MSPHMRSSFTRTRVPRAASTIGCTVALSLAACTGGSKAGNNAQETSSTVKPGAISMCVLMPKEAVNAAIGSAYTKAEASDGRTASSCHYSTETDPAGMSLDLSWIAASDYSSPAEHAALQKAGLSGAKLGGKLGAGMVPTTDGGPLHIPSGPVDGVGDAATQNMLLLTARKGDYTLMVQIIPDITTLMKDSTAGRQVVENEKNLARAVLSKV